MSQKQGRRTSVAQLSVVEGRLLRAVREIERLRWLIARLDPEDSRRDPSVFEDWLANPPRWPGQHERAIAALAIHDDPSAYQVLEALTAPSHLRLLKRVALSRAALRHAAQDASHSAGSKGSSVDDEQRQEGQSNVRLKRARA